MLMRLPCLSDSAAAALTVCAALLLARSCLCVTDGDDAVIEQKQLAEFYKKGLFILESKQLKSCITVDGSRLVLEDCGRPTGSMLWKWVSQHRLFNLGTSMCLGLNITNTTQPLGMFECDMALPVMWWRCNRNILYGASQWKVTTAGQLVVVKKNSYHEWNRYNTNQEGPCSYPYEEIHTLLGNAHGMPCALPFKYNNKWYSECTTEGREDNHLWCATSTRYDETERWGFCPVQDSSCEHFWESNQELQACYQFNLYTILTWSQALQTCQAQGGSLLSITSLAEHRYIRDRLASVGVMVWIGLNHLKDGWGWQWSDGAPLSLVNFTTDLPASPLKDDRQCGVYNSAHEGHWRSLSCESALPYICKKTPNNTRKAEPLENWKYIQTECDHGWWPHSGFCYRVLPKTEAGGWEESSQACSSKGANLTSLHSLSQVEMVLNLMTNYSGQGTEAWIGLWKPASVPTVEWSDGSPVTLTLWHQYHPPHNLTATALCAKADSKEGNWLLVSCDEQLPAVCRKESRNPVNHSAQSWDEGCPKGWTRYGHSCYRVTSREQTYEDAMMEYYCQGPLLTVENRFEQEFINSLLSESGANSSTYYWIGLMEAEDTKEYLWLTSVSNMPLTFTNWNKHQPVSAGGCVAMSGGPALGQWEVKHCKSFKALSLCKQDVSGYHEVNVSDYHPYPDVPCPPGWQSRTGLFSCYKVFHDEKVLMKRSWVEADFFCQALGAQLASIIHYEEEVFLRELLGTMFERTEGRWFWVGLNKRDPEHPGMWKWSDGSYVMTPFVDKNDEDDRRNCAVFSDLSEVLVPQPCDATHEWICKLDRGHTLKKPYWYSEQSEPWVFYRGAEYLLAKQPFDWDSVSLACQMMGAYLVSFHSKEELHFIKERLQQLSLGPADWWIGLSSGHPGEEVRWSDKTNVEFQNWSKGTARGRKNGLCVTMSSSTGKWSTNKCSEPHGYVCKRKTVSVVESPQEPHYIGQCPEKWLYFGHKCLLLHLPDSPKEGKTWRDAMSICTSFESSLVTIEDEIEQAFITMLLQGSSVGVWIGLREGNSRWTSYSNWSPIEPRSYFTEDEMLSEPLCTVLSNNHNFHLTGKWYDEKCDEGGYGFICQKPQDVTKPPTHSYHHPLPANIEYRGRNYKVVSGNMSWYDAMRKCKEKDLDLVSITDAYHQAFLTVLVNRLGDPHWIGLSSQDSGINYHWSDGSDTVYTHWDAVDDDEDIVSGECVYMDVNGGWRRADCETPLPGALCHGLQPSNKPFSSPETVCPPTWVKFEQGCYNFEPVVYKLTLEESREHCRLKVNTSGVLTIKSEKENRFVLEQLWSLGFIHHTVWLGLQLSKDADSVSWLDGSPVDYNNWPGKSPNTKLLTADSCVTTKAVDGVWHLSQCAERLGFVCKTVASNVNTEVEVEPLKGLHHSVIPTAVLVAVLIFALLAGATWFAYKRSVFCFRGLPTFGTAYYRQTSTQSSESDGNVLITDMGSFSGQ